MTDLSDSERAAMRRVAAALLVLFVATEFAIGMAVRIFFPGSSDPFTLSGAGSWYLIMTTILVLLFALYERLRSSFVVLTIVATLLSIAAGIAHLSANRIAQGEVKEYGLGLDGLFINAGQLIHFYFAWSATILALVYSRRRRAEQHRRSAAERAAHGAQMRAVRYQLNPHFLFNTLNSVGALIGEQRDRDAEGLIRGFSDYLRTGLKIDPMSDQTLAEEFAQQEAYLAIERVRFPDRLETDFSMPDGLADALVPPFVLNPLVEDAVRHGVAPSRGRTRLALSARRSDEGQLVLELEETHEEPPPTLERQRTDLLEMRLRQRFDRNFAIQTSFDPDGARRTAIHLPFVTAETGA